MLIIKISIMAYAFSFLAPPTQLFNYIKVIGTKLWIIVILLLRQDVIKMPQVEIENMQKGY